MGNLHYDRVGGDPAGEVVKFGTVADCNPMAEAGAEKFDYAAAEIGCGGLPGKSPNSVAVAELACIVEPAIEAVDDCLSSAVDECERSPEPSSELESHSKVL